MPATILAGTRIGLQLNYGGKCSECGTEIRKGDRAFYFPNGKKTCVKLCADEMHMSDLSKKPKENIR